MAKSIMQKEKWCYVCCAVSDLHLHHVFGGTANRRQSDKHGFTVWLCARHHNMSDQGVHFNRPLDLMLKRRCQELFERNHSREEFMAIIGKNYLEE